MHDVVGLDSVERILAQFSVGREERLSALLPDEKKEEPSDEYKGTVPGICLLQPMVNVNIAALPGQIIQAGFTLIDVLELARADANRWGRTYYVTRFLFARQRPPAPGLWDDQLDMLFFPELVKLASECCWGARAYQNPLFSNDKLVKGKHTLSFNFEAPSQPGMRPERIRGALQFTDGSISVE